MREHSTLISMRVALISPLPPPPGGISRWTEGLLHYASQQQAVNIVHLDSSVRFRPVWNLSYVTRIAGGLAHSSALLAKYLFALLFRRVNLVHITTSGSLGFLRDIAFIALARILRRPLVLHMHFGRLPAAVESKHWQAKLAAIACRMAGSVIALDCATADVIQSIAPRCVVSVIGNPAWIVDDRKILAAKHEKTNSIAFVGWVIPTKGVCELVKACSGITDVPFRLELIGPVHAEFREHLKSLAMGRDDGRWLEIPGEVNASEATARIARASVLVLPSYTEGAPYVVLEAMALRTPIIATPVGAIPRMLAFGGHSSCGLSVPVRDVVSLREAIRYLLGNPKAAKEMALRAQERVISEYSPAAIFAQYEHAWRNACAESGQLSRIQNTVVAE